MSEEQATKQAVVQLDSPAIAKMYLPVQCAYCARVYDLGYVTVTARYVDCSMWRSPCCDMTVDDRGQTGWKTKQDYYPLTRDGHRQERGAS